MKRILQHPEQPMSGKKYWRSLDQLRDTPQFRGWLEREFPQGAAEFSGGEVSRRNFLQLMGASMALAGLSFAGCRRPEKHLIPFTHGVEWSIPGKALFFTTAMPTRRGYMPLVATTHDGRPTKIEGNPLHPASKGATDVWAQASLLDLYDPDRLRHFVFKGEKKTSEDFEKALDELIAGASDGAGVAFLLEDNPSPTRERLRGEILKKFPKAMWAVYEPLAGETAGVFGSGATAVPQIDKADVIVALDADFLGPYGTLVDQRAFATRRKPIGDEKMNRLYCVENRFTVTGGIADHRLRVPASQIGAVALELAAAIGAQTNEATLQKLTATAPTSAAQTRADWIKFTAEDLLASKGRSLVLVGARQPAAVQAIGAAINAALGNLDTTLVGKAPAAQPAASIADLVATLGEKKVSTLVVIGGNPVHNAPVDLDFAAKLKDVANVIRVGAYSDETSAVASWQVPLAHYLEAWGDGVATDGSHVSVQPMILPLFGGWSELDVLAKFAGQKRPTGPELIQETFKQVAQPADFVPAWAKFLHDGFLADSAAKPVALALDGGAIDKLMAEKPAPAADPDSYEVVFAGDSKLDDGRYANNGWLQELPDPISKQTWDNAAWISPATARKLGIKQSTVGQQITVESNRIEISVNDRRLDLPVLIIPGHADGSITIPLGYGRTKAGRVGNVGQTTEGFVFDREMISGGFDAYTLRTTKTPYFATGAKVKVTGGTYKMAITQEHGTLEGRGPDITREATLEEYKADPKFVENMGMDGHIPLNASMYSHPKLSDAQQWAMTIDMNVCTGCSACMIACQAENNIPIVGKRQVIEGREMHWIRADRYFASMDEHDEEPELVSQPMTCQHCENAPCETVCPVNATVHSEDGINVMAYNRCVGTRYCANNCPFKVRRFNFFDYNQRKLDKLRDWNLTSEKGMEDTLKMSKNPNVTVRMRGVMEKCTFCIQRVQEAKIAAKVATRDAGQALVPPDAFTTACAQVCPTGAIVFGDKANPETRVSKIINDERSYWVLKYLNLFQRVWYQARIRNPNPKMPGADKSGKAIKSAPHGHHAPGAPAEKNEAANGANHGGHA
jgi:MoCo/4Fe-4S cofactor protein with predicted Tat translocation signal